MYPVLKSCWLFSRSRPSVYGWVALIWLVWGSIGQAQMPLAPVENTLEHLLDERYERLYVPEQDLGQLWSVQAGVLVETEAFKQLLAAARHAGELKTEHPQGFVLETIRYEAEIQQDVLRITARCRLTKYTPGWAELKLPLFNVSIKQALLDDQPAPLGLVGKPAGVVLLDRFVGTRELVLKLTTPIQRVGTDEVASFAVFPHEAAELRMPIPAGRILQVNGTVVEESGSQQQLRDVQLPVGGQKTVQIRLADALGETLEESLVFATSEYAIGIERDSVNWEARCLLNLFGKRFQQLEFVVPTELEMTHVEAAGLQTWELRDDPERPGHTRIQLQFRETIPERLTILFRGVQLLENPERWKLAPLRLLGATTHTGGLALSAPARSRLKILTEEGTRPAARAWKPTAEFLQRRTLQFHEIWEEDFILELSVTETGQEVQAAVSHVLAIEESEVRLSAVMTLQTLFSPLFELQMKVPAGWRPERVSQETGDIDWQLPGEQADTTLLRIPLVPPVQPGSPRTIWMTLKRIQETGLFHARADEFPLPSLDLEGVRILEGSYTITASPLLDVFPLEMQGLDPALLGLDQERFGYRYQDSQIAGSIRVERRPARFQASTVQTCWLDEHQLQMNSRLLLDISGGGVRQIQVLVENATGIVAEFESLAEARITDQRRQDTDTGTQWTISFDRFITGSLPLAFKFSLPRPAERELQVPRVSFPEAELQEIHLAFAALPEQQLTTRGRDIQGDELEPLDPADLPPLELPPRRRVVAGYRLVHPAATITLAADTFAALPVPTAVASRLELTTLLLEAGQYRQQADLVFQAVGTQSLVVELPEEALLWATLLDGRPVSARRQGTGFLVSLAGEAATLAERRLTVVYGLPADQLAVRPFSRITLPAPRFLAVDGAGTRQPLRLLRTDWLVHHAPDIYLDTHETGVQRIDDGNLPGLLARFLDHLLNQSGWTLTRNLLWGLVACAAFFGLAWGVTRTVSRATQQGQNTRPLLLASILGVGLICVGLIWLALPGVQSAREAARRSSGRFVDPSATTQLSSDLEMDMPASSPANQPESVELFMQGELATLESRDERVRSLDRKKSGNEQAEKSLREFAGAAGAMPAAPSKGEESVPEAEAIKLHDRYEAQNGLGVLTSPLDPFASSEPAAAKPKQTAPLPADGFLSLNFALELPETLASTRLRSVGEASPAGLVVNYRSQAVVNRLRWMCAAVGLLLFWLLRNASWAVRCAWTALLPGVSLALLGIVPPLWLPVVEGLLLASGLGLCLWLGLWLGNLCRQACACCATAAWPNRASTALLLCLMFVPSAVLGEEPAPPCPEPDRIPLVFPYANAGTPLAVERVYVPREEYLRLWRIAHPEETLDVAPVEAQVHEASYVAELVPAQQPGEKPTVRLQARYVIENYTDQPRIVPLPIQSVVTEGIEINGQVSHGALVKNAQAAVVIPTRGMHVVDARFRLLADTLGTAGQFTLELQPVATGALSFHLPSPEMVVRINEGKIPFELIEREQMRLVEFAIAAGGKITLAWQPRVASSRLEFLSCDSAREVLLGDRGAELQYVYDFRIAQGSFSEVRFQLPEGIKLKTLLGNDLAGWQLVDENQLRVLLKKPVEDRTRLTLTFFTPLEITPATQTFALPDVEPLGVTREIGSWAIGWESALQGRFTATEGVRQLQIQQFERLADKPLVETPQRVYRFTGRPQGIVLEVSRKQAGARATHFSLVDIQPHRTHLATLVDVELQGVPRLSLEFTLPPEMNILELTAPMLEDWFVQPGNAGEAPVLTVLFDSPQQGKLQLFLRGQIQREIGNEASLTLVTPRLSRAESITTFLGVGAAETLGVVLDQAPGWQGIEPERLPAPLKNMARFPIRFGLTSQAAEPAPVVVSLRRQQAQVKANSVTVIAVTDASLDYGLSFDWTITSAATDLFYFSGPAWMAGRISFSTEQIRHVGTTPWGDGQLLWSIQSKTPRDHRFFVNAVVSLPRPEDRMVTVPLLRFETGPAQATTNSVPLETQGHYAVLVNLGREPLEAVANLDPLRVEAQELPIQIPPDMVRQAMDILRISGTEQPKWELKRLTQQESPPATISLAELTTVIDGAGHWRTRAIYHVKNRQRQFLPVQLPPGAEVLSVLVDGSPARVVSRQIAAEKITLIPLPASGAAALAFPVQIVLEGRLETPFAPRWSNRRIALPRPAILPREASEEYGIPVQHTVWQLSTPDNLAVKLVEGSGTNMSPSSTQEVQRLEVTNRLQEVYELSQIVGLSSKSYRQRKQAADNLRQLTDEIHHYYDSSLLGVQIQEQQAQVLQEARDKLEKLGEAEAGAASPEALQSLGRAFVEQQNREILLKNTGAVSDQQLEQQQSFQYIQQDASPLPGLSSAEQRIQAPESTTAPARPENFKRQTDKEDSGSRLQENRRQLLEENIRQNTLLNRQAQQEQAKPQAPTGPVTEPMQKQPQSGKHRGRVEFPQRAGWYTDGLKTEQLTDFNAIQAGLPESEPEGWTSVGGLSLPVEIPLLEQSQVFAKVGGQPELTIDVRPRDLSRTIAGLVWGLLIAALVLWLLPRLPRLARGEQPRLLAGCLALTGLLLFALLPFALGWAGLALACAAGALLARASRSNASA